MEEKDFEPAGLIPRSIIRTVERFRQQLRPETIALGIQEFRISRYQVRVSVRYFFILLLLPIAINWGAKNIIIKPLVGYFWNTYGTSLFLNNYQAERAFKEMRDFESQLFFEMLLSDPRSCSEANINFKREQQVLRNTKTSFIKLSLKKETKQSLDTNFSRFLVDKHESDQRIASFSPKQIKKEKSNTKQIPKPSTTQKFVLLHLKSPLDLSNFELAQQNKQNLIEDTSFCLSPAHNKSDIASTLKSKAYKGNFLCNSTSTLLFEKNNLHNNTSYKNQRRALSASYTLTPLEINKEFRSYQHKFMGAEPYNFDLLDRIDKSNCFEVLFQEKTFLLAEIYNQQSIIALSNMFGDCIMIISIILLLRLNAPQFTILKSFLIESFYSFNDAIKCFYIILITDFLVGFHSPRGWEIVMEMLLRHLGLPENEEFILLFVGTFPVFLDTAFKYWIFRYLNKISPSTVATYHSMIE